MGVPQPAALEPWPENRTDTVRRSRAFNKLWKKADKLFILIRRITYLKLDQKIWNDVSSISIGRVADAIDRANAFTRDFSRAASVETPLGAEQMEQLAQEFGGLKEEANEAWDGVCDDLKAHVLSMTNHIRREMTLAWRELCTFIHQLEHAVDKDELRRSVKAFRKLADRWNKNQSPGARRWIEFDADRLQTTNLLKVESKRLQQLIKNDTKPGASPPAYETVLQEQTQAQAQALTPQPREGKRRRVLNSFRSAASRVVSPFRLSTSNSIAKALEGEENYHVPMSDRRARMYGI